MKNLKQNLIYNITYQVLIMIVPLITTPYLSRILGKDGIGYYSYIYTIASYFVIIIKLGLDNYGNRAIATSKDNKNLLSHTFWNIYALQILISLFCIVGYLFFCFFIAKDLNLSLIFGIYLLSSMIDITWFIAGMEEFKINAIRNAVIRVLSTIAIFIFVKNTSDVYTYAFIISISTFITQLVVWPIVFKYTFYIKPTFHNVITHLKPNLILFIPILAGTLYRTTGKLMLGSLSTVGELGVFENSDKIIQLPTVFANAAGVVMMPRISNLIINKDTNNIKMIFDKTIGFVFFTSISMSFGIMAISELLVPWYYGTGFEKCIQLFMILSPACIFSAFGTVIRTMYLIPNKKDMVYVNSTFLAAGINIIINLLLIPKLGSIGASLSVLIAEISAFIFQLYAIKKEFNIKYYLTMILPYLLAGIIMFLSIKKINISHNIIFLSILIKIVIGAFVFVTVLLPFYIYKIILKRKKKT